jgi:predicted Zn-dependent protease
MAGTSSAALLLSGCPAPEPRFSPPPPAPVYNAPPATAPPAPTPAPPERPPQAPRSLVAQAQRMLQAGDTDGASSTLDRALSIEPRNPILWSEMGRVRLLEKDPHQAEICARKSLALASGDPANQAIAAKVLAQALRDQGRNQEAQEVESRSFMPH